MHAATNQPARRDDLADQPMRVRWSFDDLVTLDGHRLVTAFTCSLRILGEPAERKLFEETFLRDSTAVSTDDILNHFAPALRAAAAGVANRGNAEPLLADDARATWTDALRSAGNTVAFSCGIELLAPFGVEATSPSLQQERLEQMQRTIAERKAADRVGHFQRAAELLEQWESLRSKSPTVTPGALMDQLNPSDRGAMLETLLMASAKQTTQPDLWAVAGPYLVRIDLKGDTPKPQLIPLPPTAGPLRSVNQMNGRVLVGARNGVFVIDPAATDQPQTYLDPELTSEHGFSGVTFGPAGVWGCHRGGGIVAWTEGQFDRPTRTMRASELAGAPRNLTRSRDGSHVLFTVAERLMATDAGGELKSLVTLSAPIASLLSCDDRLILAAEDGTVTIHDARTFARVSEIRPAARLSGAALMPWLTSARVLLTTPDGPVFCVGIDDALVTQYSSPHVGVRAAAGSAGKVAALAADRQRIVLWNAWDPRRPAGEIYLTGLTRHRTTDIAFG
jgi:hypothetical protein